MTTHPMLSLLNNLSCIWSWHEAELRDVMGHTNYALIADLIRECDELPALLELRVSGKSVTAPDTAGE